jgi:hypothetical protein
LSREIKVYYNPEATRQHGDGRSAVYTQRQDRRPRIVLCIPDDVLSTIPVTKRGIFTVTLPDPEYKR